jgi:hypothetical protein
MADYVLALVLLRWWRAICRERVSFIARNRAGTWF